MLETRDLLKVYKPKKGVPVTAINRISLRFPEKGMIFLLGKSGSGKSTLLNLLGGLDKYDDGEIIIKGVSSKDFKQQYFDSYRNTYVGFIFQEYNVLDEFTVGANIALAIELQGRKATDDEINNILKEVDLEGYGNRKPNELSGGQKQRVAIARALVKNPEIIMADEPTGALDSNTGRQVFDTLKKLSKDKLVIIVSHDREFSEQYADRIIELADGNVVSDVELGEGAQELQIENIVYDGDTVEIAAGYHLTEEDRNAINSYIDDLSNGKVRLRLHGESAATKNFVKTDQSRIKTQDGSGFKLIKSKLPLKSAAKIGASGLKYKKFRLVMTVLLSCIAFGLFGLADTFGAYNHIDACTNSLIDSGMNYVSMVKSVKNGSDDYEYWRSYGNTIDKDEVKDIEDATGNAMTGVFVPVNGNMDFMAYFNNEAEFTQTDYHIYATGFSGFADIDSDKLEKMGYTLAAGVLPDGSKNEIAISEYTFQTFKIGGYTTDGKNYDKISSYNDMLGKTLSINDTEYTITGIVDTGFNLDRYIPLTEKDDNVTTSEQIINYALYNELSYARGYSLASVAMVGDGKTDAIISQQPPVKSMGNNYFSLWSDNYDISPAYIAQLKDIPADSITWVDGVKTTLADDEIIIASDSISYYGNGDKDSLTDGITAGNNTFQGYNSLQEYDSELPEYKVVGIINIDEENTDFSYSFVASDSLYKQFTEYTSGPFSFVTGAMPTGKDNVKGLVQFCYNTDDNIRYEIQNAVTYELDTVNSILKSMSKVFLYIGIGFAVFASLMLANFIGTSISHKKQEIGILRAIGSRSNDVFRIFFSESFIIAMINFVLSSVGVFVVTTIINNIVRNHYGILITILNFGPRQVGLLLLVSFVIAAAASFIPVKKIASKKPIDAIRNR